MGTLDFDVVFNSPTTYVIRWGDACAMSIGGVDVSSPYGGFINPYVKIVDMTGSIVDTAAKTSPGGLYVDSSPLIIGGLDYKIFAQDWGSTESSSHTGIGVLNVPFMGSASFT